MSQIRGGVGYENGNYNSKYILKIYYMQGTFLSDLQVLTQWILSVNPNNSQLIEWAELSVGSKERKHFIFF